MAEAFPPLIGKYKVQGIIAKGGMGVVYKAEHPSLKRTIVLKKMSGRRSASNLQRFKREAQILLDMHSPFIVHLFDYFTEGSYRYMAEEFVDGMALDKLLAKQTVLSPQLALLILQDACLALKYAHSKDIVHRDIKPGNILISKRAEIKLADFGIATADKETGTDSVTKAGVSLGTPAYMPPEQFEDSAKVDKRADIYALGVMLYEMVTGTKPYPGTLSIETLNTIRKERYIPPQKIDKSIPPVVSSLIKKMMRADPDKRYQSTAPIIHAIKRYLKRYDAHAIRIQLARLVLSKDLVKESPYALKNRRLKTVSALSGACAASAVLFTLLWRQGAVHRTVLRPWFTPVTLEMQMPVNSASGSDLPINAFFFENDGDKIPEVAGTRRVFKAPKPTQDDGKKRNLTYVTKAVFLRPGSYRIKVAAGPYVWWDSFAVGKKDVRVKSDFLTDMRRPVKLNLHAFDGASGQEITSNVTFRVFYNGAWQKITDIPRDKMLSGSIWKIKIAAKGYKEEVFSLLLDWYQDELFLSANLERDS
ncbi:MAG: serine/threonine protein kinase [Treponema sp.]